MRVAFVLHLFYDDLALELVEALGGLRARFDVVATGPACLQPAVSAALKRISGDFHYIDTENVGRDVGPFLDALAFLRNSGVDLFCKLHTKRGRPGYGALWRRGLLEALAADDATVERIVSAFEARSSLAVLGPREFYLSTRRYSPQNHEEMHRLASLCFAGRTLPEYWGFFAGTMFWGRTRDFRPISRLKDLGIPFAEGGGDGEYTAHALERVLGLVGLVDDRETGLITDDASVAFASGSTQLDAGSLDSAIAKAKARGIRESVGKVPAEDPLVHFIENGLTTDYDPNPYFHTAWYRERNPETTTHRQNPLKHFIANSAWMSLRPSPTFDTSAYYRGHPGLRSRGINALVHFLTSGVSQSEALRATAGKDAPGFAPTSAPPRFFALDRVYEAAFLMRLNELPEDLRAKARSLRVSVIVPITSAPDRAAMLTIRSIQKQTHRDIEVLIVAGPGRSATSLEAVRRGDRRVSILRSEADSPSAKRSHGLAHATGATVAYLDPGNLWAPHFLHTMLMFMLADGHASAYSITEFRYDGECRGYGGSLPDRNNDGDADDGRLNALCHRRDLFGELGSIGRSDRLPDLDALLWRTAKHDSGFAPFVGCIQRGPPDAPHQVQRARPGAHLSASKAAKRVSGEASGVPEARGQLSWSFAIKVAAFRGPKYSPYTTWGDYHFAEALKAALERQGYKARIDPPWNWYSTSASQDDAVIVLRGLLPYSPQKHQMNLLWLISHPEAVPYDEFEAYDIVFVASDSYANFLRTFVDTRIVTLLQATDPARFHDVPNDQRVASDTLFIGNSRNEFRDIVRWAVEAGLQPRICGTGWSAFVPSRMREREYVDNAELTRWYAGARVVLADHFASMRDFGFISNRLYDVLAAGGVLISDSILAVQRLFGSAVPMVAGRDGLKNEIGKVHSPARVRARRKAAATVIRHHTFDRRAEAISAEVMRMLQREPCDDIERPAQGRGGQPMVCCFPRTAGSDFDDSAYRRLICPLTDDVVDLRVLVRDIRKADVASTAEVVVLQSGAADERRLMSLVRAARRSRGRIVYDIDGPASDVDRRLAALADHVWVASRDGASSLLPTARNLNVLPDGLDYRLWRDYAAEPPRRSDSVPRLLLCGRGLNPGDLRFLWRALDGVAERLPGAFRLYVTELGIHAPDREWLAHLVPPSSAAAYPRFAKWLQSQGPFDLALLPVSQADVISHPVRFLEYSAMGLPTLASANDITRLSLPEGLAILVSDKEQDWADAVIGALSDRRAVDRMARAAAACVWDAHTTRKIARTQGAILHSLARRGRARGG